MNDKHFSPDRLPRRRRSIVDDGPIKIYESAGSPQVSSGVSLPAVAAIIGFAAFAGMTAIYFLGDSPAAANNARPALEVAADEQAAEPVDVVVAETVQTATVAVDEASVTAAAATRGSVTTSARLPVKQLKRDDPRWTAVANATATTPAAAAIEALAKDYQTNETDEEAGELMAFAARPGSPAAEIAVEPDDAGTDAEETAAIPPAAEKPASLPNVSRTAPVRSAVNMRSRPQKGASVLTVIPARANVGIVDCDVWCHVVYEGRSGYVFRDFVEGRARMTATPVAASPAAEARNAPAQAPEAAASAPEEAAPLADHIAAGNRGR